MKVYIKVIVSLIILITIGVSPIVITEIQNKNRIDQVYSEKIKEKTHENPEVLTSIELIMHSKINQKITFIEKKPINEVKALFLTEIEKLKEKNIIPKVDLNQDYSFEIIRQTNYFDSEISLEMLTIVWVEYNFPDFKIELKADINTGKIYDLSIEHEIEQGNIKPENFFDYLSLDQDKIYKQIEGDKEYHIYKEVDKEHHIYKEVDIMFSYLFYKDNKKIQYRLNLLE